MSMPVGIFDDPSFIPPTVVVVVVVDFGSWVQPLSLNCSLAPFPSTLPIICSDSGGVVPAENSIHGCQGRPE